MSFNRRLLALGAAPQILTLGDEPPNKYFDALQGLPPGHWLSCTTEPTQ